MALRQASGVRSGAALRAAAPAEFTNTSTGPIAFSAASKQAKAEASLFKSAENTAMRAAAPGICATKVAFAASRLA